jgi:hypothetical protein
MDSTTIKTYKFLALALWGFCSLASKPAMAQEDVSEISSTAYDSMLLDYLYFDSLLLDEIVADSASFIQLLDNLVEEKYVKSTFSSRIGYSGQVTNAGRTIGINQFGFNAGATYYHKSGIFADVSGYWNSDQIPNYNTTIIDIGYMGNFAPNWSYWASYSHYFFSTSEIDSTAFPFTNAINTSTNYYIKKLSFGVDYSYSFGDETAHRIRLNSTYTFAKNNWWFFDRVSFSPNLSLLMGNASVVTWQVNSARERELINRIGMMRYRYLQYNEPERLNELLSYPVETNAFGIMNYSLFLPVTFTVKKFSLMVYYTLNLPVALSSEELDTSLNNYLSTSLIFTF